MTTIDHASIPTLSDPVRLPPKTRRPLLHFALPAVAISSGVMLCLAMMSLLETDSIADYAKAFMLAFSAMAVSYGINKLAVDKGAELGARGFVGARIVAIGSILAVGAGLFATTYAGLTLKDTGDLQLREHGQALGAYVGERSAAASSASRIAPAIRATEADLREKAACEVANSCLSGFRTGGNGAVARVVQEHAGRAGSIAQQIAASEAARERIVTRLNADIAAYQAIVGDPELTIDRRRAKLSVIDASLRQGLGELDAVVPLGLVAAYAAELQPGVSVAGQPEAEKRLNAILSRHGKSLEAVIDGIDEVKASPPSFPGRPGVSDTFGYILHFLPIAAIAFVVECVFPLVLMLYGYWTLDWGFHKATLPPKDNEFLRASPDSVNETGPASPSAAILPQAPWRRSGPRTATHDPHRSFRNTDDHRASRSSEGDR